MKKILQGFLTIALCLAVSLPASAAEISETSAQKSGETSVSFNVAPTYTVTIPETVELEKKEDNGAVTYEKDMTITAEAGVRLIQGQSIKVAMDSDFILSAGKSTMPYTVTVDGENVTSGDEVALFGTSTDAQTVTLHFAAEDPEYAGNYTDTVTFTLSIVNE